MVAAGFFFIYIHALLNYGPVTVAVQNKIMLIKLKAILNGVVIYFGNQLAVTHQFIAIKTGFASNSKNFIGSHA